MQLLTSLVEFISIIQFKDDNVRMKHLHFT